MSYLALYRKYRPSSFDQVFGQDHIVTTLKNQLKADRIGHAYLFCGTRGTGKTSIAKLFAKAVNCEHPVDGSPCGECAVCKNIDAGTSMNVIEIDAASNNGVDNIRDIVDEVRYSPTEGRYKVYIIDEVHMLSSGAFNALLKTLEEPPSYVIFILATTEVHKIPITILSRCQRYDFKRISVDKITECLRGIMEREGIDVEEKALRYVAKTADGSMRDAQSLLDQCIAFYLGQKLTYEKALEVLGSVDVEVFAQLLRYIAKGSVNDCMDLIDDIVMQGREMGQFVNEFAWYLRNLLIAKTAEDPAAVLEFPKERMEMMMHEAEVVSEETLIRYIRILSELSNRIRYAAQKRLLVELDIIKLCKPEMEQDYSALVGRIEQLERQLAEGVVVRADQQYTGERAESNGEPHGGEHKVRESEELPKALSDDIRKVAENWKNIVSKQGPLVKTVLAGARPIAGGDNKLIIALGSDVDRKVMQNEVHLTDLKNSIESIIDKAIDVEVALASEQNVDVVKADITTLVHMAITYED